MSAQQQPGSSPDDDRPAEADADATREMPRPASGAPPPAPVFEASPWSRGYQEAAGPYQPPHLPPPQGATVLPPGDPTYGDPTSPAPRFASPHDNGPYGQPWYSPDPGFPPPTQVGWMPSPPRQRRRGRWILAAVLSVALIAGLTTALVTTSNSSNTASPQPLPGPSSVPGPGSTAAPSPTPSSPVTPRSPLPSIGLIPTPPALLAIGYHAYSSTVLDPSDVAIGPEELVQFKRYGLTRIVGMRALTLGPTTSGADDYDATINVLGFRDAAAATAEVDYSNSQNKKDAPVVALPGLPDATAFYNKPDATSGISIGAFATAGRYQVVVILNGLSRQDSTAKSAYIAETARILRAVLPAAATIQPYLPPGGLSPENPNFPTPTPTGTHA